MELQVQIDDVSACPGRCPGCVLSADERKVREADMPHAVRGGVLSALGCYIDQIRPESVNITYGIADHLLIGERYVGDLYADTAKMLEASGFDGSNSTIFFSTSLIATKDKAQAQLGYLSSIDKIAGIELIPVVVLDPQNLRHPKLGKQWREYARMANEVFGRIDLALNLSELACTMMTPKELVDYAVEYGFKEVTVNWTPTDGNTAMTASDLPGLFVWLAQFADLAEESSIRYSYGPILTRTANAVMCAYAESPLNVVLERVLNPTIRHSIHIDSDGSLYPKFEAIGDVPHSFRFGYPRLGNVCEESISDILGRGMPIIFSRILSVHMRDVRCSSCEYLNVCATTGFHVYNKVLDGKFEFDGCPSVAKALWRQTFKSREEMETRGEC